MAKITQDQIRKAYVVEQVPTAYSPAERLAAAALLREAALERRAAGVRGYRAFNAVARRLEATVA